MIFDLDPYNVYRLWTIFFFLVGVNFFFFLRRRILALDPKVYLMVFLSSINAFCIERYLTIGGRDVIYFVVMGVFCNLCLLLMPRDRQAPPPPRVEDRWLWVLLILCAHRLIVSDIPRLIEIVQSGFMVALAENRDGAATLANSAILQYLFSGTLQFFEAYCFSYNLMFSKLRWRRIVGFSGILLSIISGYIGGSRAALFYTFLSLGHFLIYFRHEIDAQKHWWPITKVAVLGVGMFFPIMVLFSSFRSSEGNERYLDLEFGADRVATRFFANADGIEYFLVLEREIETDLYNFVKFNFVFLLKRVTGDDYSNFGRRLYENAVGRSVNYGGPNFTVLLQSKVAFGWLGFVYIPVLVIILYISRHVYATRGSFIDICFYNLSYCAVWFFIESEAQFARILTFSALLLPTAVYSLFLSRRIESIRFFPFSQMSPRLRRPPSGVQRGPALPR